MDAAAADAGDRLAAVAGEAFGGVDVLVNNIGGNRRGQFADLSDEDWQDLVDLNFLSHVRASRAVIPAMKAAGGGVILFVASIFGREAGGTGLSLYNTTKSALISVAKIMALVGQAVYRGSGRDGQIRRGEPPDRALRQGRRGRRRRRLPRLRARLPGHRRLHQRRRRPVAVTDLAPRAKDGSRCSAGSGRTAAPQPLRSAGHFRPLASPANLDGRLRRTHRFRVDTSLTVRGGRKRHAGAKRSVAAVRPDLAPTGCIRA